MMKTMLLWITITIRNTILKLKRILFLEGKADSDHNHNADYSAGDHNHDDEYYTEAEVDSLLDDIEGGPSSGDSNQLVQEFVVAPEESITAGDVVDFFGGCFQKKKSNEYIFNNNIENVNTVALTESKFVIIYSDSGNWGYRILKLLKMFPAIQLPMEMKLFSIVQ